MLRGQFQSSYPSSVVLQAAMTPFESVALVPLYVDLQSLDCLTECHDFLVSYRKRTRGKGTNDHARKSAYLKTLEEVTRTRRKHFKGPAFKNISRLISSLGFRSCMEAGPLALPASPSQGMDRELWLPVERFYCQGNPGAGRHLRCGPLELKGVGRGCATLRSDWIHSSGTLPAQGMLAELIAAIHIDSISPLGSVPISFAALILEGDSPAVFRYSFPDGGSDFTVLGQMGRECKYIRPANLYFGPEGSVKDELSLPPMREVVDQFAAMTAFGSFQLTASPDNLTLDGRIVDAGAVLLSAPNQHFPQLEVRVQSKFAKARTVKEIIKLFFDHNCSLEYSSTSLANLCAIETIASSRELLGKKGLQDSWKELYLVRLAAHWFVRNGLPLALAEELAPQAAPCFLSQFDAYKQGADQYLRKNRFKLLTEHPSGVWHDYLLRQEVGKEAQNLKRLLDKYQRHTSDLIKSYNYRALNSFRLEEYFPLLRESPETIFSSIFSIVSNFLLNGCYYNPASALRRRVAAKFKRDRNKVLVSSPIFAKLSQLLSNEKHEVALQVVSLNKQGGLKRQSISAKGRSKDSALELELNGQRSLIIEGAVYRLSAGREFSIPIGPLFCQELNGKR